MMNVGFHRNKRYISKLINQTSKCSFRKPQDSIECSHSCTIRNTYMLSDGCILNRNIGVRSNYVIPVNGSFRRMKYDSFRFYSSSNIDYSNAESSSNIAANVVDDHISINSEINNGGLGGSLRVEPAFYTPSLKEVFNSIIKIYCDSTDPNYAQPWQMRRQIKSIGSGFVIENRLIVTNAHCVSWQNRCLVRKPNSTAKYPGRIIEIGHDCDLAILTVDDESFWEDLRPLKFGKVPNLHDGVIVVGYPTGGDNLCITSGVVSRVDVTTYVHSQHRLLCAQIDAAINPGNSGGPALKDGKVIGVAFQANEEAQNIGYIIPSCIVEQFLLHIQRFKKYTNFVTIGMTYQLLENPTIKTFLGLNKITCKELPDGISPTGIMICQTDKLLYENPQILKHGDVVLSINGYDVADDGTVHFRDSERVHLAYALTYKFIGEECQMLILRDGKLKEISITLSNPHCLVPLHQWDVMPRYYIYGGLVFVPLTMEYLKDEFGKKFYERAPSSLLNPINDCFGSTKDEEVVILSQILASELTVGYDFRNIILESVNDIKITNLKHMQKLLEDYTSEDFVKFTFEKGVIVVLDGKKVQQNASSILQQHAITSHVSLNL
ncbi:bifunctional Peptidase S1C/PDZ superfamily/Protease Do-like [Babesia duncani]|uniref:Bifunctional Peptidase S1C/PDZ superfamily/Protease Do-like n=1 Tax=Babesia duncani TaxID=323732 RepID=A0AAD9PLY6_9APIC|nr:bifunctional Peptidase S1C/PDZ superfamily/Protease Do-like [Babesia duncani]